MMLATQRIVLIGSTGMLGGAFQSELKIPDAFCLTRDELDITRLDALLKRLTDLKPNLVINCAADTNVEGSESNRERAFAVNAMLPTVLAQVCHSLGVLLVHFSSTGCYGSYKSVPYDEYDKLCPTTVHHKSKAAGEEAVQAVGYQHLILRLGWLYGGGPYHKKNFVLARIIEGRNKTEILSDPYQAGVPTNVMDVVQQTKLLIETGLHGTFNCVAGGATSRFDYVRTIVEAAGLNTRMLPNRFTRLAPVSPNETAINFKLNLLGLNRMPDWNTALRHYILKLLSADGNAAV